MGVEVVGEDREDVVCDCVGMCRCVADVLDGRGNLPPVPVPTDPTPTPPPTEVVLEVVLLSKFFKLS